MNNFQENLMKAVEKSVLKLASEGSFVKVDRHARHTLDSSFISSVWKMIDQESLKAKVVDRLEAELANKLVNHIAAELATDVKQILSSKEQREQIRGMAREHIKRMSGEKS